MYIIFTQYVTNNYKIIKKKIINIIYIYINKLKLYIIKFYI